MLPRAILASAGNVAHHRLGLEGVDGPGGMLSSSCKQGLMLV